MERTCLRLRSGRVVAILAALLAAGATLIGAPDVSCPVRLVAWITLAVCVPLCCVALWLLLAWPTQKESVQIVRSMLRAASRDAHALDARDDGAVRAFRDLYAAKIRVALGPDCAIGFRAAVFNALLDSGAARRHTIVELSKELEAEAAGLDYSQIRWNFRRFPRERAAR